MERLDKRLVDLGLCKSREQAQAFILAGEVWTGEQRLEKPGMKVAEDLPITVRSRGSKFVSRAGEKLEHGIHKFKVPIAGRVCIDIGASTGGFTDCLLQEGARRVFALDVGYGQLDSKLRDDPRVTVMERTNARYLTRDLLLAEHTDAAKLSLATIDVSFISLERIIPAIAESFAEIRDLLLLFKPQFEVGRESVGKGGLVKDAEATQAALERFQNFMLGQGFSRRGEPEISPLTGKKSGNVEYLVYYARD